jgi:hypothetical protein
MPQGAATARVPDETFAQLQDLYARASELKVRAGDLAVRRDQLAEQRANLSPAARAKLDAPFASVQHEYTSTMVQIEDVNRQIADLQHARDMAQAQPHIVAPAIPGDVAPQIPITIQPPPDLGSTRQDLRNLVFSDGFQIASFLLLFPFAIALARRLWIRAGRRTIVTDIENSPRLQRIEQAIESIAIEVERIGEAQRFTTKLLGERAADPVAARLPQAAPISRREPGTITPH